MSDKTCNPTYINDRQIDWQQGRVTYKGQTLCIEPKLLKVLTILFAAPDRVISQQELLEQAWPDSVVSPNTIQRCIGQLRKLLGDDAHKQKVIKTLAKRGYCFNSNSLQTTRPGKAKTQLLLILTVICFSLTLWLYFFVPNSSESKLQIQASFDGAQSNQYSARFSRDQQKVAFVQQAELQQLKLKDLSSQVTEILVQQTHLGESIEFSSDSKQLLYSTIEHRHNSKCSQLFELEITAQNSRTIGSCRDGFYQQLQWMDNGHLLYLWQEKDQRSKLELLDLSTNQRFHLAPQWQNIETFAYDPQTETLAILIAGNTLVLAHFADKEIGVRDKIALPQHISGYSELLWDTGKQLLLLNDNQLLSYKSDKWQVYASFNTDKQLQKLIPTARQQKYLAQLHMENWDIHLKTPEFNKQQLTSSGFKDHFARFRPNSQQISFISDRSGSKQVWLREAEELTQSTSSGTDLIHYLWSEDGKTLFYTNLQGLWQQTATSLQLLLSQELQLTGLSQYIDGALLLGIKNSQGQQFALYNTESQKLEVLLNHPFTWAQLFAGHTLITNDSRGRLQKYVNGVQQPIIALPEFIIQPYYFAIDNKLYVQDKSFNIWAYDPVQETAKIVDHYDENSVFMTDYLPKTKQLLTENYIHKQQQLVWLSTEPN